MRREPAPSLILALLLALCFTLATYLQPCVQTWTDRARSDNALHILLGDGRRIFANHYFIKADVYFHSGYYPSIFDQAGRQPTDLRHMVEEHHDEEEHEHEKAMDFMGHPRDWIERFGRNFYPTTHSHLDRPGEAREILPWLRISADLDPQRVETYTVASYWLRKHLGKAKEAEEFLREGLNANPSSFEILLDLGKLYYENYHDTVRARNLWELALRRWREQDAAGKNPEQGAYLDTLINLAHLEEETGNLRRALMYRELEVKVTPQPAVVQKEIDDLKQKLASAQSLPPGK